MEQGWTSALFFLLGLVTRSACLSQLLYQRFSSSKDVVFNHAQITVWNFGDDHVGAADRVLLHDARIITFTPRTGRELRNHECRLVVAEGQ